MGNVWDSTIDERLSNGSSVVDELFNCINNYNQDFALRLLHPSRFDGEDIAFELRKGFSWCIGNIQSFAQQMKDYPLVQRTHDLVRMIAILIRDYEKQLIQDDNSSGEIWRNMGKVYQYGAMILSDKGIELPPIPNILFRSINIPKPQPTSSDSATTKEDSPLPDFSHMESYSPTTQFNMSALYSFLIEEGIIDKRDITEIQLRDCIIHADIKLLMDKVLSKNRLKLALQVLKKYFQDDIQKHKNLNPSWYLQCCESVGMSPQEMGKMKIEKLRKDKFCIEMKKRLSTP